MINVYLDHIIKTANIWKKKHIRIIHDKCISCLTQIANDDEGIAFQEKQLGSDKKDVEGGIEETKVQRPPYFKY